MRDRDKREISATRWIEDLRRAREALDGIDMDEGVRKTIWRALGSEFVEACDRFEDLTMKMNDGTRWTDEDDATIVAFLKDKPIPPNWLTDGSEHWRERRQLAVELAFKLHRGEKNVEKRATALGFRHFS